MNKSPKNLVIGLILAISAITGFWLEYDEQQSYNSLPLATNSISEESQNSTKKKININTASVAEIHSLYGIGEVLSEKIVAYRNEHGKFEVIEDIMKVNGIGRKTFDRIKENITVD